MAYTILINNDNTAIATERQRLLQRSKLVDTLRFIVPKAYNGYNMADFDLLMEYRLPISHELKLEKLNIVNDNYKNEYILYTVPIDTSITVENGDVEVHLTFANSNVDADGNYTEHVRKIDTFTIPIVSITSWFSVPDQEMDTLVQMYLANQQQINALNDLAGILNQSKADNLKLDVIDGLLYLTANGIKIGDPIRIEELGNEIVEHTKQGTVKLNI